jgi:phosphoribosylglycinamide formyltransferase-1
VLRLAVLASGGGTNLGAIFRAIDAKALDAQVVTVVSNRGDAGALDRARERGVPTAVVPHQDFVTRELFDAALVKELREARADWVVLAGFMRLVTPVLLDAFPLRVINVHPALLPAFPGAHAHRDALAYGVRVSGCTVHFVDAGADTGPIIAQTAVAVSVEDTAETLAARVLVEEHALLPRVLQWIAEGRVTVEVRGEAERPIVRVRAP